MRNRAAQESDILHAREADIADILAAPAHQTVVFLARQADADTLFAQRLTNSLSLDTAGWHPDIGMTSSASSQRREVSPRLAAC